jgi:hypothetical protein
MNIEPTRLLKLHHASVSHKSIARLIHKRTHTVKSGIYGKDYHASRQH